MEKLKTRNEYVGCNGKCRFYADEITATSYKHWDFVKVINGKVVFNWYQYSNTTTRHQWAVHNLMKNLGIKIDATVYMRESLTRNNFQEHALYQSYVNAILSIVKMNTPRVRKKTKAECRDTINSSREQIKKLKEIGATFSFKEMLRIYRNAKNRRDDKENFLKGVKGLINNGKVYTHKEHGGKFEIMGKDNKCQSITLKNLDDTSNRFYNKSYHSLDDFQNNFMYNPLATALVG